MPNYTYTDPEESNSGVLEPGEYDFTIDDVLDLKTSQTGNEYLPIKLRIEPDGVFVFDNLVFTDKARFRISQLLKSISKAPAPGTAVNFDDPSWLIGCKGRVKLKVESFNGTDRNKVDSYLFRKSDMHGRTMAPTAPAAPSPSDEGEEAEDNLPF